MVVLYIYRKLRFYLLSLQTHKLTLMMGWTRELMKKPIAVMSIKMKMGVEEVRYELVFIVVVFIVN